MVARSSSPLFARPNLKLFLLGAVLIVLVNDLFSGGQIQASARTIPSVAKYGWVSDDDLNRMVQHAIEYPSVQAYLRVSDCYHRRGDFRRAMVYLLRAESLEPLEDRFD